MSSFARYALYFIYEEKVIPLFIKVITKIDLERYV